MNKKTIIWSIILTVSLAVAGGIIFVKAWNKPGAPTPEQSNPAAPASINTPPAPAAAPSSAISEDHTKYKTRYGLIEFTDNHEGAKIVLFNTKEIFRSTADYLNPPEKIIRFKDQDIILIGENCGGSACGGPDHLHMIVVIPSKAPLLITDDDFNGDVNSNDYHEENGALILPLGEYSKKTVQAAWDGASLTISKKKKSGLQSLSETECKDLYSTFIPKCTISNSCKDVVGTDFSMAEQRSIPSNNPGFNDSGFYMACDQSCNSKHQVSYEQFKLWACHSG